MSMEEKININHRALPVFADRTVTATQVAAHTDKKEVAKEGTIRLIFVDSVSGSSVADVVMTSIAAEQLIAGIRQSVDRLRSEVKKKVLPKSKKTTKAAQSYIG